MGLTNNVIPFSLIAWAQGHVPSGFAAILNATTPIFAVILANAMTSDEKMTQRPARRRDHRASLGVAVMIGPDALAGATDNLVADLALLRGLGLLRLLADLRPAILAAGADADGGRHRAVHRGDAR